MARSLILVSVWLAAGWSAAATAQSSPAPRSVSLSPAGLLNLGGEFEKRGQADQALAIYTLLGNDRDLRIRAEARFRHARLLVDQGKRVEAATLLRRLIDDMPSATAARLSLAGLLGEMGDIAGARRQLRAVQADRELPRALSRQIDRYAAALRSRAPFGWSVDLALAPDSNINRATRSDTIGTVIGDFDLSEDGRQRSGVGAALAGQLFGRMALGDSGDTSLLARLSGSANLYRQRRFGRWTIDAAVGPEWRLGSTQVAAEVGASQSWFGGKPHSRSLRLSGTAWRPLGSRTAGRLAASVARIDNRLNNLEDGTALGGTIEVEHALGRQMGVSAALSGSRFAARDPGYATRGWTVAVGGWREIGGATVALGYEHGRLAADERLTLFPDRRRDQLHRLSISGTLRRVSMFGFSPVARLTLERNRSTLDIHDYRRTRTEFGIARSF